MAIADLYNLPLGVYTGTSEPITIIDPIYPRRREVHRGSRFMFHGHSVDEPTEWIVEDIITENGSGNDRVRSSVNNVRRIHDIVWLRCDRPFQRKRLRFIWLSNSAAWRLVG